MHLTESNFSLLWDQWQISLKGVGGTEKETLRHWLSKTLHAEIEEKEHGRNWVMWESERSVPAGRLVRRTLIASVLPETSGENSPSKTFQEIRNHAKKGDILLLILVGASQLYETLAKRSLSIPCATLFQSDVRDLLFSENPNAVLRRVIHGSVDLSRVNPYSCGGAVPQSMFFNRDRDMDRITRLSGHPVAIVGQRGIGKSSLLREAHRRLSEEPHVRVAYIDCEALSGATPHHLEQAISRILFPRQAVADKFYHIDELARRSGKAVYLFIDEVDRVIEHCDASSEEGGFYARIKGAAAAKQPASVVMAGWNHFWLAVNNPRHQLYNTFEVHPLGPLGDKDATQLIVEPIESLGLRLSDKNTITKYIRNWSSCHPSYIQLFCERLVELASASRREVLTMKDVNAVAADESLYEAVAMPFIQSVAAVDKAITYAAMHLGERFTIRDLMKQLKERWNAPATVTTVQKCCERLVVFNVFMRENTHYKFLISGFPSILQKRQPVADVMTELVEEVAGELRRSD